VSDTPERKTATTRRPASRRRAAPAPADSVHPHVLLSLLDQGVRFDAEYREGLSNHLPMALVALRRLGCDPTDQPERNTVPSAFRDVIEDR